MIVVTLKSDSRDIETVVTTLSLNSDSMGVDTFVIVLTLFGRVAVL